MTRLIVSSAADPNDVSLDTEDFGVIAAELAALGARVERWQATHPLAPNASQAEILAAYAPEIDRLKRERGYQAADVVSIKPNNPNWPALRQKFVVEHIHHDDEVRYFVEGSGAFYIHVGDRILQVVGEAGDLLSVPQGTPHWFDGGETADFTCIRVFTDPAGWEAHYTGDETWRGFPRYHKAA
ncbi:1,2-dihydroxy-3-keto-5-methylthiopentene dioxygenase [Roseiarcus sp.]|jgi:1,2-dihydroxy-3-keto-5-methylthiopentene dioxygenase|uniref:1,2-dihydroxy-3-keto-5-methylthiopentene dioxygenase n=1 Tax=Roseiarcus sp. TaxID=1969460 RepID=UPI003F9C5EE1